MQIHIWKHLEWQVKNPITWNYPGTPEFQKNKPQRTPLDCRRTLWKRSFLLPPKGFSFENVAVYFPRITPEFEGNFCSPRNPAAGKVWERRGDYSFFLRLRFPCSLKLFWKKNQTNNNKKKIIKIDLQWNNIIFIVTATAVPRVKNV